MRDLSVRLPHPPTLADLEALPAHMRGEIIDGVLYTMRRPHGVHQHVVGAVCCDVHGPFERGRGGPGGWRVLLTPGISFDRETSPEESPDAVAWTRERVRAPWSDAPITVQPDWVCEVLEQPTRRHDLHTKRPFYARMGVPWMWVVDPDAMLVTAHRNEGGLWVEVGVWGDERDARLPPFEAVPLDVAAWWVTESA